MVQDLVTIACCDSRDLARQILLPRPAPRDAALEEEFDEMIGAFYPSLFFADDPVCTSFPMTLYQYCCRLQAGTNAVEFRDIPFSPQVVLSTDSVTKPGKHTLCFHTKDTPASTLEKFSTPGQNSKVLGLWKGPYSEDLMSFVGSFQRSAVNFLTALYDDPLDWRPFGPFHDFISCNWLQDGDFFGHFVSLFPASMGASSIENYDIRTRWEDRSLHDNDRVDDARQHLLSLFEADPDENMEPFLDEDRDFHTYLDQKHLFDADMTMLWMLMPEMWINDERSVLFNGTLVPHSRWKEFSKAIDLKVICHPRLWSSKYWEGYPPNHLRVPNEDYETEGDEEEDEREGEVQEI